MNAATCRFVLELPRPFVASLPPPETVFASTEERMRQVIAWSKTSIELGGGPFAAGVFEMETGRLVAPGLNRVVPGNSSLAHAEITALLFAQQALACYNLRDRGRFELCASSEPCAQCYGALPWAGVCSLVFGASRQDVEQIGFDEGPKPSDWIEQLRQRGIEVQGPVCQAEAVGVLRAYAAAGNPIYNGGA